jgi:hypothetical protein
MSRAAEPVRAIGRIPPDGPLVGIEPAGDGYRLAFGLADGTWLADPTTDPLERRAGLVAGAIAFFLASLDDPPAELEATQADLARAVASLDSSLTGREERATASQALDAIDDGLPADAVALRLLPLLPSAQADPVEILRARYARATPAR